MLKVLIKKQFLEIFRSYFYNEKKNTARSKGATALCILGFVLLVGGMLGGIFTILSLFLCGTMLSAGVGWLYFALLGLLAILLGTFGSVFNTYASLYLSKDNDLLLAMPIPVSVLMASRLLSVYLMGLIYSGVVSIPAVIVYLVITGATVQSAIGGFMLILLISIFVLTLSCGLGLVVARISLKLKNKSMITVLLSLVFLGCYYFVYYKAQDIIQNLLVNLAVYGSSIKKYAYPVYLFGSVGEGNLLATVILSVVVVGLFALVWKLISRSFFVVATSTGNSAETKRKKTSWKQKSVSNALLGKEFCRFTSSSNYMLNCGFGLFMTPILAVAVLWKGKEVFSMLGEMFAMSEGSVPFLVTVVLCGIVSMNIITAPSVSLEGKNLWLVQSLPVTAWQVLRAKLRLHLLLTEIPMLICMVCIMLVCPLKATELLLLVLQVTSYVFLTALFGLLLGVKKPIFTWTNEIVPVKQSMSVMISLFAGLGYTVVMFMGYMALQGWTIGYTVYMMIFIVVNVVASAVFYLTLRKEQICI